MTVRSDRARLLDILEAIAHIERYRSKHTSYGLAIQT
jgi:uncharacterized protein with HEPN domain